MSIDTTRVPNERARRAADNYERINRENKDLRRDVEDLKDGIRALSALVTDGASKMVKENITARLDELGLLPIEEPEVPVFEETARKGKSTAKPVDEDTSVTPDSKNDGFESEEDEDEDED